MLNSLKYKESNIFADIWFIEKVQQERSGKFSIRLGKVGAAVEGTARLCSGFRYLSLSANPLYVPLSKILFCLLGKKI